MPKFLKEITFSGQSTPATPNPGYGSVYIDGPTNLLYYIDDAGVTYDLTSGTTGTDVFVTGGTYSAGTATFTNNTGGTFNVTGFTTGGTSLYWYDENDTPPAIAPIATGAGSIALGNGARALSCNMFVYGNTAGSGATNSCFSNFIGYQAGEQATNACQSNLLGPSAGYQATNASNSNFIGTNAGYQATNACNSNFLGNQAGSQATTAINSNFFGPSAGQCAANANNSNFFGTNSGFYATNSCYSNFLGTQAGCYATNACLSNFIGGNAGFNATNASGSNFLGERAGFQATNANNSNFLGTSAGCYATNASGSTFMGQDAGFQATNACNSNFIGICAGNSASGAYSSNFFGWCAGHTATSANNSNFLGLCAGYLASNAYDSNFLGKLAGSNSTYANSSNFFGFRAGDGATNSCFSNFIGPSAGRGATDAFLSNFFGPQAGQQSTNASASNFFGFSAGFQATNSSYSNFFGSSAGCDATNASGSNFLGERAGVQATSANNSNFIGTLSGYFASASCYSTFIGYQTGKCFAGNNLCRNNIIIGTNITLPNGRRDSLNIGGTIFGEDLYYETVSDPFTGATSSGKIGIGVVSPTNTLHISGTTNPLRIQGLITSANTNYLVANSDGVVTLTSGSSGSDTYVTGFTYNSANTLTIQQNNAQPNLTASINTMTGLTIIGNLSATTYQNLPTDVFVTGGTYSAGTATFTNNTGGTFSVTGFTTGGTQNGLNYYVSGSTPTAIQSGDRWFNTNTGLEVVWIDDGDSSQWVQPFSVPGPVSPDLGYYSVTGITTSQVITWDKTYWGVSGLTNIDLTLPATVGKDGYYLIIKDEIGNCGTYRIRLTPSIGLIDGNNYVDMNINYMSLTCMSRGGNWYLI